MPRRYAAHLRVKGLPAGSSSDLQGCKPSRSLLILLNLHPPSLFPFLSLSLSSRFPLVHRGVDNSSSCRLDNFLSARLAAQSMTQTFAIWISWDGGWFAFGLWSLSWNDCSIRNIKWARTKSSDWLDIFTPFLFLTVFFLPLFSMILIKFLSPFFSSFFLCGERREKGIWIILYIWSEIVLVLKFLINCNGTMIKRCNN